MSDFNYDRQVQYWKDQANTDISTAEILIEKRKILHGLFFCHLTIEKALKAHYVKVNLKLAPKTHNLLYLVDNAGLELDDAQLKFLTILQKYQLEGRYPGDEISIPGTETAEKYLQETKELLVWLMQRL